MNYYSQIGQDRFVDQYFKAKEHGVFVDLGAHDGVSSSNSYFFERERKWTGLCVEPGIDEYKKLVAARSSQCLNACVSNYNGTAEFTYVEGYANMLSGLSEAYGAQHRRRVEQEVAQHGGKISKIQVDVFTLQTILDRYGISAIDYCSIDTEGAELSILESIDFSRTSIRLFTIENNYGDTKVRDFLASKGYRLLTRLRWDDVFEKC
jgi:FkbM family methyltransferase